jgi:hypothetical protein
MIQANELRVGNLIKSPYGFSKIDEVGLKDGNGYVKLKNKNMGYYLDVCSPIQLTDEILLKCGFKKGDEYYLSPSDYSTEGFVEMMCFDLKECEFIIDRSVYSGFSVSIKHLHQLQNLYFALTGEELQITL